MGHEAGVNSVAFSPSGDRIVSGSDDGTLRLWHLDGTEAAAPFVRHGHSVNSVAFSPSGDRIVSGGAGGTVLLWHLDGTQAAAPFVGHKGLVHSVAFSPSGDRIVSGGADGTLRLWHLDGTQAAAPFVGHKGRVHSVAFSPSGDRIVSGSDDGTVRLWHLDGTEAAAPFEGHGEWVHSVAFSPSGDRIVSGGVDGTLRLWHLDGTQAAAPFVGHEAGVNSVAISPSGDRIVSGSTDGTVRLWHLDGTQAAAPFVGHVHSVNSVAFSPSGDRIVSGSTDGTLRLWHLYGTQAAAPLEGHGHSVHSVAFRPSGDRIVSGSDDGTVRLWHLDGTEAAAPFEGHGEWVNSVAFSPSGDRIVSGGADGTLRLWHLDGTEAAAPFVGHEAGVNSVAFNPSGDRIVSGSDDGTLRLWHLDGTEAAAPFVGHGHFVNSVAFSPSGDRIVSGGTDGTVRLWHLDGTQAAAPFVGHGHWVHSVAISPSGDRIVSGGFDGTVLLWHLDGTQAAAPFVGHKGLVHSVAFSPSGDRIVSGSADGTVRLWEREERSSHVVYHCQAHDIRFVTAMHWAILCSDRIAILDGGFREKGAIFLHQDGLVALTDEGVFAPTADLHRLVRAFGEDGTLLTRIGAVPSITPERLAEVLFDAYTPWSRLRQIGIDSYTRVRIFYAELGWLKAPFWPGLVWALIVLSAAGLWLLVPARLAASAMPLVGAPQPPPWKWFLGVLTFYGWLGQTRRPLRAWMRRHRQELERTCFLTRKPVCERASYSPLGHDQQMNDFENNLRRRAVVWIDGVGGSGKSALAYQIARTHLAGKRRRPIPILVDADWDGTLADEVSRQLRLPDALRGPTEEMARTLGAMGLVCPIIDSLSERRMPDAVEHVTRAVQAGHFRHLIVTSRAEPPKGAVWGRFQRITPSPIRKEDVPHFIATYASGAEDKVAARVASLVAREPLPSPLFLRFAIEQAVANDLASTDKVDLVLHYLEALREGRVDLSKSDMLRAASIAAIESTREEGRPLEIDRLHLRGVLSGEADRMPFMDEANAQEVPPPALIDRLVSSGLVNETRTGDRVQFGYDPVAEYLSARWLWTKAELEPLRDHLLFFSENAVAAAYHEIAAEAGSRASQSFT
ncbi:hypothetical protein [Antarctobacter jejuensis]|uniref:hypothetical protein n=1 Tax=Antarctobacter jejuensis TaxID=1439938 RepID=UPI003FCF2254